MKFKLLILSVFLILNFSCKKENQNNTCDSGIIGPILEVTYFPMSVGSYWVYQWYKIDTLGNEEILPNWIDTMRILKDTIIENHSYAKIKESYSLNNSEIVSFRRDSLGYLIDEEGTIYFSAYNYTDTLRTEIEPMIYETIYKMVVPNEPIETAVGTFESFDYLNYQAEFTSFINTPWATRFSNTYFVFEVGVVQESNFFFSSLDDYERRLIEYHIE